MWAQGTNTLWRLHQHHKIADDTVLPHSFSQQSKPLRCTTAAPQVTFYNQDWCQQTQYLHLHPVVVIHLILVCMGGELNCICHCVCWQTHRAAASHKCSQTNHRHRQWIPAHTHTHTLMCYNINLLCLSKHPATGFSLLTWFLKKVHLFSASITHQTAASRSAWRPATASEVGDERKIVRGQEKLSQ